MFEVSSIRTNTSSKFSVPLIRLQSASASVRWCGFFSGIHNAAWQPRSCNQLDRNLECLEATNLEKWSLVYLDTESPQLCVRVCYTIRVCDRQDRQTDRQTRDNSIHHASIASCGSKPSDSAICRLGMNTNIQ